MTKKVYFDMDGTIANLYAVDKWLENIHNEVENMYKNLEPMVDMNLLQTICKDLQMVGYKIGVITWLPPGRKEYREKIAKEKREWLARYMPIVEEIHIQEYMTPKQTAITTITGRMILVDDNEEVRNKWNTPVQRKSIDATNNMIEELKKLLDI